MFFDPFQRIVPMRCIAGVVVCLIVAMLPAGCRSLSAQRRSDLSVMVEGGGRFPAELAGTWKADRDGWEMVIEPDGRISSAVISLGRVRITPGKTETLATHGGGEGVFQPGPWTVYYHPETNDLTVKIVMSHVRIEMAEAILEGGGTDTFSGPISSADGIWQVQWTYFSHYVLRMPDGAVSELATDSTYGETSALTFEKTSPP
jgi:hypothetical protein